MKHIGVISPRRVTALFECQVPVEAPEAANEVLITTAVYLDSFPCFSWIAVQTVVGILLRSGVLTFLETMDRRGVQSETLYSWPAIILPMVALYAVDSVMAGVSKCLSKTCRYNKGIFPAHSQNLEKKEQCIEPQKGIENEKTMKTNSLLLLCRELFCEYCWEQRWLFWTCNAQRVPALYEVWSCSRKEAGKNNQSLGCPEEIQEEQPFSFMWFPASSLFM